MLMKNYYSQYPNAKLSFFKKIDVRLFLIMFVFNNAFGQLDGCATSGAAGQLIVNSSCTAVAFNSTFATDYWNSATGCNSEDADDAWGWFDATATTTIITYTPTVRDAILHLFTGACATTMTHIACSDTGLAGEAETITYATTIGVRYLIRIQRYNSSNDMFGTICVYSPPPPTITNLLTASSGCVGSSITITGTNLAGVTAANVRIGGTAVASITSNTATQIVAVVGTGTTGSVSVTTIGGTATSVGTFTVNPLPTATWASTATSVCQNASAQTTTLAYSAITNSPTSYSITWNASPANSFVTVTNQATSFSAPGTITIDVPAGTNAGTYTGTITVRNANGCVSSAVQTFTITVNPVISTLATVPSPATAATGICYAGGGAVTSISWTAAAGAVSYDVYFGAGSLPGTVTANVATTSYTTGTLLASTTYYWKIVPRNSGCPSTGTALTWTFTTAATPCAITYCTPTYASGPALNDQIANVTLGTLNNTSGASLSPYYTFFNSVTIPDLLQTSTASVSITFGSDTNQWAAVWIDFNQNGVFETTEGVVSTVNAGASGTTIINIPVPVGATLGNTRMRVRGGNDSILTTAQACGASSSGFGETEDYIVNIIAIPVCTTPTAQPTSLVLTPGGTAIAGVFTAASPAPSNYLVVINTTGAIPTPINNGTTYTIGGTFGTGNTVVDIDSNNTFTASGLNLSTLYYIYVFSYNSACSGGPVYLTSSPLNGSITTLATSYCLPSGNLNCTSGDYIANVTINTLNNNTTCNAGGYTNFPATGTQTTTLTRGNTYNLSVGTGTGTKKHGLAVWIDFNQNQSFADVGEYFTFGNGVIANSTNTIAIPIPAGTALGSVRMRVRYGKQINMASTLSCTMSGTFGETEDYTLTIISPIVCVAPISQPTALILNSAGTTIAGSFTAPSPAPNNYLVVISTLSIAPSPGPNNTTSYAIGATVTAGYTVVDNDANTTFTATGLTTTTTYYFYVYAFNSACSGGPTYNLITPLSGSVATITSNYCVPSVSNGEQSLGYFSEVSFVGTLNDVSNYSTFSSSPLGYQDFTNLTNLSRQAQGEGVNVSVQALNSSFMKAWVDWNKNGSFTDAGEEVYTTGGISTYSTTFGFIIPASTPIGNYRIRIRLNSRDFFGPPFDADSTPLFTSCGNINWGGETEDYLFTVVSGCNSLITEVTDGKTCGTGTVNLVATSTSLGVTEYRWYTTPTGATLVGSSPTGSWTTPSISTTTTYYVTAFNGCESLVRTAITAFISPIPTLTYSPTNPTVCGEDVVLNLTATGDVEEVYLIDEKFNSGLGTFANTNIASSGFDTLTQWQNQTSTYVPSGEVWFPAISTGINGNNFAFTNSDEVNATAHTQLASATVSTANFTSLTLSMRMFYSRYYEDGTSTTLDYVTIDVSTNGGGAWTEIRRYTEDVGIGTRFETISFNLSGYLNQANLKVRVRYYGAWCDGVAVDDIELYGFRPIGTALSWTSSTTVNAFTDAACTTVYVSGTPAVNVYVKPSLTQLELGSYSFTANATLANGCTTSQIITVTNNSKIWEGTTNTDWNTAANWKPDGVPTSSNCIIIPDVATDPIISGTSYDAFGKNILVKSGGNLTVNSDNNITITDEVKVNSGGLFDIKNSASLIQTNDAAINTGSIKMTRTTRAMTRYAYVYGGSPIAENAFSQIPSQFDFKYRWTSGTLNGAWVGLSALTSGEGYIARVRNIAPFSTGTGTIDFVYTGTPKNGIVNVNVDSYDASSLVAGNTVLLANPYPSAINGSSFLTFSNNTELGGTLFFWTSVTLYSGTGPYTVTDYGTWNLSGGVGTSPASAPSDLSLRPNGKIAAGQGFFAQAFADGPISFNNNMRVPDFNSQFFRNSNTTQSDEKNRIWLNLYSDSTFRQMLVGYIDGATDGQDRLFDGDSFTNNEINIYSLLDNRKLVIQGKGLPFDENDVVPLGYKITNPGVYSIAIDEVDGIFAGSQTIYLRDKLLTIDHDIKTSPYTFSATAGNFDDRFELVYVTNALGTNNPNEINTFAMISNNTIRIESSELIKEINIYDIAGKLINTYSLKEFKNQFSDNFNYPNGVYIAKITLDNNITVSKKLIK